MYSRKKSPSHPGQILYRQYLLPLGLTVSELARVLAVSRKTISKIINQRGAITADMALRLSQAFNTSPQYWLNMQQNYDLWQAANSGKDWKKVETIAA